MKVYFEKTTLLRQCGQINFVPWSKISNPNSRSFFDRGIPVIPLRVNRGEWKVSKLNMVYYIFCSCLFIFVWLFIGFLFFLKSGYQNNYSTAIKLDKIVISFLCFLNLPSHQTLKIIAQLD